MDVSHTQLIISSELKYKVDICVRYVNIVNVIYENLMCVCQKTRLLQ